MCGRYSLAYPDLRGLDDRFTFRGEGLEYKPRYNVAPTQEVLTVVGNGERQAQYMRWGLIPFWAKDEKIGYKMINARAETVAQKPSFKNLLKRKRCLIIADGFYEWRKEADKAKTPIRITLKGGEPFAFAGLWGSWKNPSAEVIHSCTIITTSVNKLMAQIHNRMPVILPFEAEGMWLDSRVQNVKTLMSLLKPFPADSMDTYQVSSLVSSVKNDVPECILPIA